MIPAIGLTLSEVVLRCAMANHGGQPIPPGLEDHGLVRKVRRHWIPSVMADGLPYKSKEVDAR